MTDLTFLNEINKPLNHDDENNKEERKGDKKGTIP